MSGPSTNAWQLLASQPVAVLATINSDGSPHLVPFVYTPLGENTLVSAVDEKPKTRRELRRLENVLRDPRVSVLAHHYEEDWTRLWWVRAEGTASVSESPPAGAEEALRSRYSHYTGAELGPWLTIRLSSVRHWSA